MMTFLARMQVKKGKEAEFVRYPGGSHGVHTPSQQVDRIKRGLAWYESHAPAKPAARTVRRRTDVRTAK